jgi:2-oxoglutarate ferredoxin oxidoreductase subunit beta
MSESRSNDKTRFNTERMPNWCPGCGNFGMQRALKAALLELDLQPHQVAMASGIGCSSKIVHWVNVYGFHSLHGRALPLATGIKLANHGLVVIAEGGDGDGYSEGMNHFIQAARRNVDFTYIVHNNGVFALTTGQASTTGNQGRKTPSTPHGAIEPPFRPAALAIAAGATFVARGFSGAIDQLKDLYVAAIRHRGFALVDVMQVCVSFNPEKGYKWYQQRVYKLEDEGHDPSDRNAALALALDEKDERLATGVFYRTERGAYEDELPQLKDAPLVEHDIGDVDVSGLIEALI